MIENEGFSDHVSWLLSLTDLNNVSYRFSFRQRMLWLCHLLDGQDIVLKQIPSTTFQSTKFHLAGYKNKDSFGASLSGEMNGVHPKTKNSDIGVRIAKGVYSWTEPFKTEAGIVSVVPFTDSHTVPIIPPTDAFTEFYDGLTPEEQNALELLVTQQIHFSGSAPFRLKSKDFLLDESGLVAFMEKLSDFRVVQIVGPNKNGLQERVWELDQSRFQLLLNIHHAKTASVCALESENASDPIPMSREDEIRVRCEQIDQNMLELKQFNDRINFQRSDLADQIEKRERFQKSVAEKIKRLTGQLENAQRTYDQTTDELAGFKQADVTLSDQLHEHTEKLDLLSADLSQLVQEREELKIQRAIRNVIPWLEAAASEAGLDMRPMLEGALRIITET